MEAKEENLSDAVPAFSHVVEAASLTSNDVNEETTISSTICRLPDGTFSVASVPKKEIHSIDLSNDADNSGDENDEEFERLMLYILVSATPSGGAVIAQRWKYNYIAAITFLVDTVALFLVILAAWMLLGSWELVTILTTLALVNLLGGISMYYMNIRGISLYIIAMFNRTIVSLVFLPTPWFAVIIPSGFVLLCIAYFLRNTFYAQWFPAVA
mmetsp:Transcript_23326/g.29734  ORF Transcript_23326/g.29734 Transcript_23326/m.29734 type:complete len:213 (-) Transcript_23326:122-760(-)